MATLPRPWAVATPLASVPEGTVAQSTAPNTAASGPVTTPAAIMGEAARARSSRPTTRSIRSKTTAIPSSPNGNGRSIGWMGCPNSCALLSMSSLLLVAIGWRARGRRLPDEGGGAALRRVHRHRPVVAVGVIAAPAGEDPAVQRARRQGDDGAARVDRRALPGHDAGVAVEGAVDPRRGRGDPP